MSKKFFLSILALFLATSAFAQIDPQAATALDKTASAILNKSSHYIFDMKVCNASGKQISTSEGEFFIKKDRFKLIHPDMSIFYDGKTQWTLNEKSEEVNINTPTEGELEEINPMQIFAHYKDNFKARYNSDSSTAEVSNVDLFPNDREKPYFRINFQIRKSDNQPIKIISYSKDGSYITFDIKKIDNPTINDSEFVFDTKKFPNIEIIDLR